MNSSVIFVKHSKNTKLSSGKDKIASTYVPIEKTCSDDCSLKDKVCYAQTGYVGISNARMERTSKRYSHNQIIRMEANKIKKEKDIVGLPLRLHVSGDNRTVIGAKYLASAGRSWLQRGGGPVYTYTHSWRRLKRKAWGPISVLASIEDPNDVELAKQNGYASALIVDEFPSNKRFELNGHKFIPCPNQTFDISCAKCKLCFDGDKLLKLGHNIAFRSHSVRKNNLIQITKKAKNTNTSKI